MHGSERHTYIPFAVAVLDARPWVVNPKQGGDKDIDWDSILMSANLIKNQEVPLNSIAGVIHNIGQWGQDSARVSLNIFAVVVFYTPPST